MPVEPTDSPARSAGDGPGGGERTIARVPAQAGGDGQGTRLAPGSRPAPAPPAIRPSPRGRGLAGPAAGWTAAALAVAGSAWLLTSLITYWTSYAIIGVTGWQTLTYGARSAQVSFSVHNSGSAEAGDCVAHLQLGHRRVIARNVPAVPAHGIGQFFVTYRLRHGAVPALGYAWATCGDASTRRQRVPTVALVSLVTSQPQITVARGGTTVRFRVRNLGSQPAAGCHALMRLSSGVAVTGAAPQPRLSGGASAVFSVRYDPAAHAGSPAAAWAQCPDSSAGEGLISSNRVYLRALLAAPPRSIIR